MPFPNYTPEEMAENEKRRKEAAEKRRKMLEELDKLGAHDLFKQPLEVGDTIAWPTSAGRAVGLTVGRIVKITFKKERNRISSRMYTIQARPLKAGYSGHYFSGHKYVDGVRVENENGIPPVTIQKVQNIVKVEVPPQQMGMDL